MLTSTITMPALWIAATYATVTLPAAAFEAHGTAHTRINEIRHVAAVGDL